VFGCSCPELLVFVLVVLFVDPEFEEVVG